MCSSGFWIEWKMSRVKWFFWWTPTTRDPCFVADESALKTDFSRTKWIEIKDLRNFWLFLNNVFSMGQKRLPANALLVSKLYPYMNFWTWHSIIASYNEQFAPMLKEIQWVIDHRHCGIQIQGSQYTLYDFWKITDSSRGLKCKTFCKMCSCKNSAKNLQKFCRFFCNFFATFLQLFATFLQLFCNFFFQFFFREAPNGFIGGAFEADFESNVYGGKPENLVQTNYLFPLRVRLQEDRIMTIEKQFFCDTITEKTVTLEVSASVLIFEYEIFYKNSAYTYKYIYVFFPNDS